MEYPEWTTRSVGSGTVQVDIWFKIAESFFTGDPNNQRQINDPAFRKPLGPPGFPQAEAAFASTREVEGHEDKLAAYYQRILKEHRRTGRPYAQDSHYFWLRLFIGFDDGEWLAFPWHDTREEMTPLFDRARSTPDGGEWSDIDQGWYLSAIRIGDRIHFRGSDDYPDGEEWLNVSIQRDLLINEIEGADSRLEAIIAELTRKIGDDHWTRRRWEPPQRNRPGFLRRLLRRF